MHAFTIRLNIDQRGQVVGYTSSQMIEETWVLLSLSALRRVVLRDLRGLKYRNCQKSKGRERMGRVHITLRFLLWRACLNLIRVHVKWVCKAEYMPLVNLLGQLIICYPNWGVFLSCRRDSRRRTHGLHGTSRRGQTVVFPPWELTLLKHYRDKMRRILLDHPDM